MKRRVLSMVILVLALLGCSGPQNTTHPPPDDHTTTPPPPNNTPQTGPVMPTAEDIVAAKLLTCQAQPTAEEPVADPNDEDDEPTPEIWGCTNPEGEVVIPYEYSEPIFFAPSGLAVTLHNTEGFVFINARGEIVAQAFLYDWAPDEPVNGRLRFEFEGKTGYMDESFNIVIPAQFDSALRFDGTGKAKVCIGCDPRIWNKNRPEGPLEKGRVMIIDTAGEILEEM